LLLPELGSCVIRAVMANLFCVRFVVCFLSLTSINLLAGEPLFPGVPVGGLQLTFDKDEDLQPFIKAESSKVALTDKLPTEIKDLIREFGIVISYAGSGNGTGSSMVQLGVIVPCRTPKACATITNRIATRLEVVRAHGIQDDVAPAISTIPSASIVGAFLDLQIKVKRPPTQDTIFSYRENWIEPACVVTQLNTERRTVELVLPDGYTPQLIAQRMEEVRKEYSPRDISVVTSGR
ncbi:hypothetical protein K2X33_09375, partial [bacterium]|nr:hypothetical protein [bacterium]